MDITTWAVLPPTGASSQAAPWSTPITSPRSLPTTPPCRESRRYRSTSAEGEYLLGSRESNSITYVCYWRQLRAHRVLVPVDQDDVLDQFAQHLVADIEAALLKQSRAPTATASPSARIRHDQPARLIGQEPVHRDSQTRTDSSIAPGPVCRVSRCATSPQSLRTSRQSSVADPDHRRGARGFRRDAHSRELVKITDVSRWTLRTPISPARLHIRRRPNLLASRLTG